MPIYWAFLTYMLLKSGQDIPAIGFLDFVGVDKVIHIAIFVALGGLLKLVYPKISFVKFFTITLIYSILTEILQGIMNLGRSMEFYDLIADSIGLIIGFELAKLTYSVIEK